LPAWYKALASQNGCGYMHESEGSVITDIWKSSAANYNTALRKAAEHEPISRNRCNGSSEIQSPRLSMLLTGTFNQYRALVPSVENGYFSRLLTVVIRGTNPFDKHYVSSKGGQSVIPRQVGHRLLRTYETLMNAGEREWSLTDAQKERLGEHLETEYGTLIGLLGDNFHSAVIRMAVQIERMAMILSVLRASYPQVLPEGKEVGFLCTDEDYETAELIGNRLLLHMAAAFRMINGDDQECVPEIKPLDQRKVLFEQLKGEYALGELINEAKSQGVSRSSAIRWNNQWIEQGLITKENHGNYKKIA
jgi:hypothetical protein